MSFVRELKTVEESAMVLGCNEQNGGFGQVFSGVRKSSEVFDTFNVLYVKNRLLITDHPVSGA